MRWVLVALVSIGCSGETPPNVDANPMGRRCGMTLYDLCFEEHDCATDNTKPCHNFTTEGFQVCTQACSSSMPCPADESGAPATCDNSVCKPAAPNTCHLP